MGRGEPGNRTRNSVERLFGQAFKRCRERLIFFPSIVMVRSFLCGRWAAVPAGACIMSGRSCMTPRRLARWLLDPSAPSAAMVEAILGTPVVPAPHIDVVVRAGLEHHRDTPPSSRPTPMSVFACVVSGPHHRTSEARRARMWSVKPPILYVLGLGRDGACAKSPEAI